MLSLRAAAASARVLQPATLMRVLAIARPTHVPSIALTRTHVRGFAASTATPAEPQQKAEADAAATPKKKAGTKKATDTKKATVAKKTTKKSVGGARKTADAGLAERRAARVAARRAREEATAKARREMRHTRVQARRAQEAARVARRAEIRQARSQRLETRREEVREKKARKSTATQARRERFEQEVKARHDKAVAQFYKHPVHRPDGAPRPPLNPYAAFNKQQFAERPPTTAGGQPKETMAAMAKSISKKWNEMPADEKAKWTQAFAEQREAYEAEMREFQKTLPPKRPVTMFVRYVVDNQGRVARANPGSSPRDVIRLIAGEWKALPASEKAAMSEKMHAEFDAWKKAVEVWRQTHPTQKMVARPPSVQEVRDELKARADKAKAREKSRGAERKATRDTQQGAEKAE